MRPFAHRHAVDLGIALDPAAEVVHGRLDPQHLMERAGQELVEECRVDGGSVGGASPRERLKTTGGLSASARARVDGASSTRSTVRSSNSSAPE